MKRPCGSAPRRVGGEAYRVAEPTDVGRRLLRRSAKLCCRTCRMIGFCTTTKPAGIITCCLRRATRSSRASRCLPSAVCVPVNTSLPTDRQHEWPPERVIFDTPPYTHTHAPPACTHEPIPSPSPPQPTRTHYIHPVLSSPTSFPPTHAQLPVISVSGDPDTGRQLEYSCKAAFGGCGGEDRRVRCASRRCGRRPTDACVVAHR